MSLMSPFTAWLNQKYDDWHPPRPKRKSVSNFAEYVGVGQPHMIKMLAGQIQTPNYKTLVLLAERLGDEVFDCFRPEAYRERRVVAEPLVVYRTIDLRRDKIIQRIKIASADKLAKIDQMLDVLLGKD